MFTEKQRKTILNFFRDINHNRIISTIENQNKKKQKKNMNVLKEAGDSRFVTRKCRFSMISQTQIMV